MAKGRVYCRDKRGREVNWGQGKPWVDFSIVGPDGQTRRVRRRVDARSKAEAEMELARIMTETAASLRSPPQRTKHTVLEIGPCVDAWEKSLVGHNKPSNVYRYANRVKTFVRWMGPTALLSSVTNGVIAEYRDERMLSQGRAPNTVSADLTMISNFFTWCMDDLRRWVTVNPVKGVKRPRAIKKTPDAIESWDEVVEILDEVKDDPILAPAYRLAFSAVCREEIAWAAWTDINWKRGSIRIPDGRGKNATRSGEMPLHPIALEWLQENRQDVGWIVPIPRCVDLSKMPLGIELERARARENNKRKTRGLAPLPGFHKGRHTIGTLMVRAGAPLPIAQRMLRHANPSTTARYYVAAQAMDAQAYLLKIRSGDD